MLYIASALSPTPILDTLRVKGLTGPDSISLVVAKPNRIEIWDVNEAGLTFSADLELWGSVVGISLVENTEVPGLKPHLLVLLGPPDAHLLLLSFQLEPSPSLIVTSSLALSPPTPTLRRAEFFNGVISQGFTALVSLWVGVVSCIEIDVEKEKEAKRRRSNRVQRLVFKDNFNINLREHNLLHLAFLPSSSPQNEPTLSFLWLSSNSTLHLQARRLAAKSRTFNELSKAVDVVMPTGKTSVEDDTDFNDIPLSCPAARRVVPVDSEHMLVIGDEHTCLYNLSFTPQSPQISRGSLSSSQGPKSPRGANTQRSPQNDMMGGSGKRRKSSAAGSRSGLEVGERWNLKPLWRVRQGFGTVLSATVLETHASGASVLIGDECGRLTCISWETQPTRFLLGEEDRYGCQTQNVCQIAPPSSLTYLDNGYLFLSSGCSDSSLVNLQIPSGSESCGSSASPTRGIPIRKGKGRASGQSADFADVEDSTTGLTSIKERWTNLAPVRDFDVVREEGGGISHLVVASGVSNSNSLRIIRSGVGLEDLVTIEGIEGITDLWPVASSNGSPLLLGSTPTSTFVLQIEPEITAVDIPDSIASRPTLSAAVLESSLVQITACGVVLWSDLASGNQAGNWEVPNGEEIVAGHICGSLVAVARRRGKVDIISASSNGLQLLVSYEAGAEVASLAVIQLPTLPSPIIAVATWEKEILVYALDQIQAGASVVTSLSESFPSLGTLTSTSGVQLIAGSDDGSMITYDLEPSGDQGEIVMKGKRLASLGNRPLKLCQTAGLAVGEDQIVAVGLTERMSVVFESSDRIDFSTASRKDIVAAANIPTTAFGHVIALASGTGLSFTRVNSLKKLSVSTMDTGDRTANKIISMTTQKLLALGTVSRVLESQTGDVLQSSYIELRDPTTLDLHVDLRLKDREEVTCLQEVLFKEDYYLAVGTAILPNDEDLDSLLSINESSLYAQSGRLLLVAPEQDASSGEWKLKIVHSKDVPGPVNDIASIHGFLAIAAGSTVTTVKATGDHSFLEVCDTFSSVFVAQHLLVVPPTKLHSTPRLIVGDGMRSLCVLEVDLALATVWSEDKDMATHQVMALQNVKDQGQGCIIADGHSNLLTFRLDESLESAASFGLHEDVVRFRQGSLVPPSSAPETMTPDLLFATADGRIGIIGELTTAASQTMNDLQRNMARYHKGPGGMDWKTWRRGGTELVTKDTAGFVDGDFIQRFLDTSLVSAADAEKMLNGTNAHEHVGKLGPDGHGKVDVERADVLRVLEAAAGLY
ncbi:CPSF A subunit region-domain-containing protein [Kockovaella imperatae]|uniref:DNA damage-binding protein 1 n=1 Tax=Kockovaella imperatae TaxID=4999 RepID=A0A1Y1UJH0_9TREE|nr:CPSF A subunit region-domain-containing protein [Kockovaella imperatae]ORX37687.1 CPSF A subunit region-domain-containing protein [Kockovaella imperatae]